MKALLLASLLLVAACERPTNEHRCLWLSPSGGDGGGGAGAGTGTGGTGGAAGSDAPASCDPQASFAGSISCFTPDPMCCDLKGADLAKHCFVATLGARPVPVSCASALPLPTPEQTDGRACGLVATTDLGCAWGASILLCCEP